jgi:hypothetical protein
MPPYRGGEAARAPKKPPAPAGDVSDDGITGYLC